VNSESDQRDQHQYPFHAHEPPPLSVSVAASTTEPVASNHRLNVAGYQNIFSSSFVPFTVENFKALLDGSFDGTMINTLNGGAITGGELFFHQSVDGPYDLSSEALFSFRGFSATVRLGPRCAVVLSRGDLHTAG
jgi:hypothetical protein